MLWLITYGALALSATEPLSGFRPQFDQATLASGAETYVRVRVWPDWREDRRAADRRFVVEDDTVIEISPSEREEIRRVRSADGSRLRWLGAGDRVAYFAAEPRDVEVRTGPLYVAPIVRRLDLEQMDWLPRLAYRPPADPDLASDKQETSHVADHVTPERPLSAVRTNALGDVLIRGDCILLLTYRLIEQPMPDWPGPRQLRGCDGYSLTCFDARAGRTIWSKSFPWSGRDWLPSPMHSLRVWGSERDASLRRLNWLEDPAWGDSILLCAGEKEDLICLSCENGEELWRTARIWEYERGFTGFRFRDFYMERFGLDEWTSDLAEATVTADDPEDRQLEQAEQEKAKEQIAAASKAFYDTYEGWIVAGPVVVPEGEAWRDNRIFVATARTRKREWADEVAQCVVYELDQEGELRAMGHLPRMVDGASCKTFEGGLVWGCKRGSLIRLATYEERWDDRFCRVMWLDKKANEALRPRDVLRPNDWGGPNDALCMIDWYREIRMHIPPAYSYANPRDGVACFSERHLFRPSAAYLREQDDRVYRLLINVVDLATGLDHDLTLAIPFAEDLSAPKTRDAASSDRFPLSAPLSHLPEIADLQLDGEVLRVVLETEERKTALDFDVHPLIESEMKAKAKEPKNEPSPEASPVENPFNPSP